MSRWEPPQESGDRPPQPEVPNPAGQAQPPLTGGNAPLPPSVPLSPVRRVSGQQAGERAAGPETHRQSETHRQPAPAPPLEQLRPRPGLDRVDAWGDGRRRFFRLVDEEQRFRQRVSRWMGVAGLALVTGLLILAWSAVQVTRQAEAELVLQEALAPLTDIDRLLERDYADLVAEARSGASTTVIVKSYPLGVAIPAAELATMTALEARARVLSESAGRVYERGLETFQREDGGRGSFFSPRGVLELTAGQLTSRNHTIAIIAAVVLLLFLVPMLVLVLSYGSGRQRAQNLGLAILLGGVGLALAVLIGREVAEGVAGSDDVFGKALLAVGTDLAWLPFRNALIFAALGALVLAGAVGARTLLADRSPAREAPADSF